MVDGVSYQVAYDDDGNVVESFAPPPAPRVGSSATEAVAARLKLVEQAAAPTAEADAALIYALDDAGATKVYVRTTSTDVEIGAAGGSGDMTKAVYDADEDGLVDHALRSDYVGDIGLGGLAVDTGTGQVLLFGTGVAYREIDGAISVLEDSNTAGFEQWFDDGAGSRGVSLRSFTDESRPENEKEVTVAFRMPQDWDDGDAVILVQWVGDTAVSAAAPLWCFERVWREPGRPITATLLLTSDGVNYINEGSTDPDIAAATIYTSALFISAYAGRGSTIVGRLYRHSSDAGDTYDGGKCGLLSVGFRYKADRLGRADANY